MNFRCWTFRRGSNFPAFMPSKHYILNKDGILDILLAGNDFDLKPQFGRLDANYGITLLSNKDGKYSVIEPKISGFFLKGAVRNLHSLKSVQGDQFILAGVNNAYPKIFKLLN